VIVLIIPKKWIFKVITFLFVLSVGILSLVGCAYKKCAFVFGVFDAKEGVLIATSNGLYRDIPGKVRRLIAPGVILDVIEVGDVIYYLTPKGIKAYDEVTGREKVVMQIDDYPRFISFSNDSFKVVMQSGEVRVYKEGKIISRVEVGFPNGISLNHGLLFTDRGVFCLKSMKFLEKGNFQAMIEGDVEQLDETLASNFKETSKVKWYLVSWTLKIELDGLRKEVTLPGFSAEKFNFLASRGDAVYLGNSHGLYKYVPSLYYAVRFTKADGLPANTITCLYKTKYGLLVGTSCGWIYWWR